MITYVDTSTLFKLIIDEEGSDRAALIWSSADAVAAVTLIRSRRAPQSPQRLAGDD